MFIEFVKMMTKISNIFKVNIVISTINTERKVIFTVFSNGCAFVYCCYILFKSLLVRIMFYECSKCFLNDQRELPQCRYKKGSKNTYHTTSSY